MAVSQREEAQEAQEARRGRGTAIISRARLARQQTALEQVTAVLLLLLSLAGSLLAGGGGVEAWLSGRPAAWPAVAAGVVQFGLTAVQWIYAAQGWRSWRYLAAVAGSSALTLVGFWPLAWPWLTAVALWLQVPSANAPAVAGGALVLASVALDIWPERTLTH